MPTPTRFRIAYIGGGSRFVVTLLHGLASRAEDLAALGRPIELVLMDPAAAPAAEMARYAAITARQTHLPIAASVTADLAEAIGGADWVILSAGLFAQEHAAMERFGRDLPAGLSEETGARTAIAAAAVWPTVSRIAERMAVSAPNAVFSTLVNPTDVTAAAVQRRWGVQAVGMCVEVGGLVGFLAYYLRVPAAAIRLEHIGVNHSGWVGRWTLSDVEGDPIFRDRIPARMAGDDWYPWCDPFVAAHRAVGCLRTSPYHHWPLKLVYPADADERLRRWHAACLGSYLSRQALRQATLAAALAEGRMISEADGCRVHPEAAPYTYPDTRHLLGALAVGLAGGLAGPVPLQSRNGPANPALPADAWLEVPTRIAAGRIEPQPVTLPPPCLTAQVRLLAQQRSALADWLATADRQALTEALLAMPEEAPLPVLVRLAEELE